MLAPPYPRFFSWFATFATLAAVAGCATVSDPWYEQMVEASRVEPVSEVERLALLRMDELPPDAPIAIEGKRVVAGEIYLAASGRTCRTLRIEDSNASLACREERTEEEEDAAPEWYVAPDVFGAAPVETAATARDEAPAAGLEDAP